MNYLDFLLVNVKYCLAGKIWTTMTKSRFELNSSIWFVNPNHLSSALLHRWQIMIIWPGCVQLLKILRDVPSGPFLAQVRDKILEVNSPHLQSKSFRPPEYPLPKTSWSKKMPQIWPRITKCNLTIESGMAVYFTNCNWGLLLFLQPLF